MVVKHIRIDDELESRIKSVAQKHYGDDGEKAENVFGRMTRVLIRKGLEYFEKRG